MKKYKDTNIVIKQTSIFKKPRKIDTADVQNQITQEEYNNFCFRLQSTLENQENILTSLNKGCTITWLATFIIFALTFVMPIFTPKSLVSNILNLLSTLLVGGYAIGVLFLIMLYAFQWLKHEKLKRFIHQENIHIWNPKDLNWLAVDDCNDTCTFHLFLVLQVAEPESNNFEPRSHAEVSSVDLELGNHYIADMEYYPVSQQSEETMVIKYNTDEA